MFSLKSLRRGALAAAAFTLSALTLGAQTSPQLVGVLRTPPLPQLAQKVNAFGYATDTSQMLQFLTLMTLGQVGYPSFSGASRTENAGIAVFQSGTGMNSRMSYVILAKFAGGSSVPKKIQKAGLAVKEVGGWTAMAQSPAELYDVSEGNITDILKRIRQKRTFDFEFEMSRTREQMQAARQQVLQEMKTQGGSPANQRNLDLAFSFLENFKSSLLGLNLNNEQIMIGTRQVAWPGTPEAKLLSASAGGDVPVARYVPGTGNAGFIYHTDPVAVSDYLKVFFDRMETAGENPQSAELHEKLEQTLRTIARDWDGTGAYALTFQPEEVGYVGVVGGDWEAEPLSQMLNQVFDQIVPAILDEVPIEQYANAVQMATAASQSTGTVSSALPGAVGDVVAGGSLNTLDNYEPPTHQIVDGMIVLSNRTDELERVAANVASDETAEHPLSQQVRLDAGHPLRGYIDLKRIYLQSLQQMQLPASPSMTLMLNQLAAAQLAPMAVDVQTGDDSLTATLSVPVETFRTLSGTLQKIRQLSSEQGRR